MFRANVVLVLGALISLSGCAGLGLTENPDATLPNNPASERAARSTKQASTIRNVLVSPPVNPRKGAQRTAITTQSSPPPALPPATENIELPASVAPDASASAPRADVNETAVPADTSNAVRRIVIDLDQLNFAPVTKQTVPELPDRPRLYKFGPTRPGDTLADVADELVPSERVTLAQMMWALYRKNPGAFTNQDINRLKPGSLLHVPELDELTAISRVEAETQIARLHGSVKPRSARDTDS